MQKSINYAQFVNVNKFAQNNHVVGLPNHDVINTIAKASPYTISWDAEQLTANELLPCIIHSPLRPKNLAKLANRLNKPLVKKYWVKVLRGYYLEQYAFTKKLVGGNSKFVYSKTTYNYKIQQQLNEDYLNNNSVTIAAYNGQHYTAKLADLVPTEKDKIGEIYSDMKLVETIAENSGLISVLVTFTAPPEYHANPSKGKNRWGGYSSREALSFIYNNVYRKVYVTAHKASIQLLGFVVPEPHKDGCPHVHAALFVKPSQLKKLYRILIKVRKHIARTHNCKNYMLDIKPQSRLPAGKKLAKPSSYVMKYVLKSFNCPDAATWYSRTNGREIRRYNILGLRKFKTKYNYLYKMRNQLLNVYGNIPLIKELATMLKSDTKSHLKKLDFYYNYNHLFKGVYIESECGEYTKLSHLQLKLPINFIVNNLVDIAKRKAVLIKQPLFSKLNCVMQHSVISKDYKKEGFFVDIVNKNRVLTVKEVEELEEKAELVIGTTTNDNSDAGTVVVHYSRVDNLALIPKDICKTQCDIYEFDDDFTKNDCSSSETLLSRMCTSL